MIGYGRKSSSIPEVLTIAMIAIQYLNQGVDVVNQVIDRLASSPVVADTIRLFLADLITSTRRGRGKGWEDEARNGILC